MSGRNPPPNSMATMVEMAAQHLLSGQTTNGAQDQVFFTGVWNDAYPAIIVRDPLLPDSAKIQLLYLMQAIRANPYGANPLPSVEQTARDLGKSPTTVVRDRAIIRMARWGTQCRRVRDPQGRMRGLVWSVHSEPVSLAEATSLDPEYMGLLEQAASGHFDRIARRVAKLVLAAIDHDIGEERDPLEAVNPMERRLEALETLRTGHGRCFAGYFAQDSNSETGIENQRERVSKFETSETGRLEPVSKFETSAEEQVSNLETRPQPPFICSSRLETSTVTSSSSSSKKTTTIDITGGGVENTVPTQTLGDHPSKLFSEPVPCGLENGNSVPKIPPLIWPPDLDDNRKRLVQRMLHHHLPDRPDDHQEVLNALAVKFTDKADPIRNLGYYVTKLCKLAKTGELCPVEPPSPPPGRSPCEEFGRQVSHLRGEIGSLKRLIEAARHSGAGNVQALEEQLARRKDELRELEQRRH